MTWVSLAEQGKEGATKKSMVDGVKFIYSRLQCVQSYGIFLWSSLCYGLNA